MEVENSNTAATWLRVIYKENVLCRADHIIRPLILMECRIEGKRTGGKHLLMDKQTKYGALKRAFRDRENQKKITVNPLIVKKKMLKKYLSDRIKYNSFRMISFNPKRALIKMYA